jgi:hypothetical protein
MSCRVCPVSTEKVEIAGTVINISRSGILVGVDSGEIPISVKPDAVVRVELDLPRHPVYSPRCLECVTSVVRIVTAKAQTQLALRIGQIQLTDQGTLAISTRDWFSAPIEGLIP